MPTYDYVCDACGHGFEHFQGINEELLRACPTCRKRKLRRLIGAGTGILFKGSGFYETDYKRASRPPQAADSNGEGKGEGKDRGKDASGDGAPAAGNDKDKPTERSSDTPSKAPPDSEPATPSKDGKPKPGAKGDEG